MSDQLSDADRRRVQKYDLLKKFGDAKKDHFKATRLCVGLGMIGAHRFYLGHRSMGIALLASFAVLFIAMIVFQDNMFREKYILPFIVVFIGFYGFEIFRINKVTDRVNLDIKKALEEEFYI